jgi:hypothetical protein
MSAQRFALVSSPALVVWHHGGRKDSWYAVGSADRLEDAQRIARRYQALRTTILPMGEGPPAWTPEESQGSR